MGQDSYDPESMNQDIALATGSLDKQAGAPIWLTDTPDINEADSSLARWGDDQKFVVGWAEPGAPYVYRMAVIETDGSYVEGPIDVSAKVGWGRRDDPFRRHANGDVVWAWFDEAGSTHLRFARLKN